MAAFSRADIRIVRQTMRDRRRGRSGKGAARRVDTPRARLVAGVRAIGRRS